MRTALVVVATEVAAFLFLVLLLRTESIPLLILYGIGGLLVAGALGWAPRLRRALAGGFSARPTLAQAMGLLLLIAFPFVLRSSPYWIFVMTVAGLYVVVVLGLNLQTGTTGLVNLAGAALYGTGAYTAALLAVHLDLPGWVTVPAAGLAALLVSVLLFVPVLKVRGHYLALVTIAFGVMFNIMLNNTEAVGGPQGIKNVPGFRIAGLDLNDPLRLGSLHLHFYANYLVLVLLLVLFAFWVARRIGNSPAGLVLNAIRDDEWAAQTSGVNMALWKLLGFCAGSVLIGLAGGTYAHLVGYIAPGDFTFQDSLFMLSMVILGGMDSIAGSAVAAVLLVLVTEKLRVIQEYRFLLYGLMVVGILIFRPQGLIPAGVRVYFRDLKTRAKLPRPGEAGPA